MARQCEVCANVSGVEPPKRGLQRFLVEGRVVVLCGGHARVFREQRPETLAAVAELFREREGRRSLLARRAPLDRRQFPMRPEGRRRSDGRRATDDV